MNVLNNRRYLFVLALLFLFCVASPSSAQTLDEFDITYGLSISFGYNNKGESNISLSGGIGFRRNVFRANAENKNTRGWLARHISPAFQSTITVYYNGLGDNILDHYKSFNIDFVNSLFITAGHHLDSALISNNYITIQPFNSQNTNLIGDEYLHSLTIGTNFIINQNNRNQRVGFANANIGRIVHLAYYNDGPPFNSILLADGYDRWWTGGGFVRIYFDQGFSRDPKQWTATSFTLYYDRFTGDIQDAYLGSNLFGFQYIPARDLKENFYTRARYKYALFLFNENYELSYQRMGHLKDDFQDKIHDILKMPHHLSYSTRTQVFGLQYHNVFNH